MHARKPASESLAYRSSRPGEAIAGLLPELRDGGSCRLQICHSRPPLVHSPTANCGSMIAHRPKRRGLRRPCRTAVRSSITHAVRISGPAPNLVAVDRLRQGWGGAGRVRIADEYNLVPRRFVRNAQRRATVSPYVHVAAHPLPHRKLRQRGQGPVRDQLEQHPLRRGRIPRPRPAGGRQPGWDRADFQPLPQPVENVGASAGPRLGELQAVTRGRAHRSAAENQW